MENSLMIPIKKNSTLFNFEVKDYPHDEEHVCKFEIYLENRFVASFQPDQQGCLHICQNPGNIEQEVLHKISDEIEKYHW